MIILRIITVPIGLLLALLSAGQSAVCSRVKNPGFSEKRWNDLLLGNPWEAVLLKLEE